MAKAVFKGMRKYRSYGSSDPFFLVAEEDPGKGFPALASVAYHGLHMAFVALLLVAGIDKFTFILVDWSAFLAPASEGVELGIVRVAGVLEMVLAIGLLMRPRPFSGLLALWIAALTVNLLVEGMHFDLALLGLALVGGTGALAYLSKAEARKNFSDSWEGEERPAA